MNWFYFINKSFAEKALEYDTSSHGWYNRALHNEKYMYTTLDATLIYS